MKWSVAADSAGVGRLGVRGSGRSSGDHQPDPSTQVIRKVKRPLFGWSAVIRSEHWAAKMKSGERLVWRGPASDRGDEDDFPAVGRAAGRRDSLSDPKALAATAGGAAEPGP